MKPIDIPCPQCGLVYQTDAINAGKFIKCTRCRSLIHITTATTAIVQPPPAGRRASAQDETTEEALDGLGSQ